MKRFSLRKSPSRQETATPPPEDIQAYFDSHEEVDESKPLPTHKKLQSGTLQNGFEYMVLSNDTPRNTTLVHLEVRVGSVDEEENEQGLAHFLEHLVFLGTEKFPTTQTLHTLMSKFGMSFGGDTNAYTDFRSTVYTLSAPLSTNEAKMPETENVRALIEILSEISLHPLLKEECIKTERGAVLSELKIRNTIDFRQMRKLYDQVFPDTMHCKRFPIGKEDQIKKWIREDFVRFHKKWYKPQNMTLYIVSPFQEDLIVPHIKEYFGKKTSDGVVQPLPRRELAPTFIEPRPEILISQNHLIQQFSLGFNIIYPVTPLDTYGDVKLMFIDTVISHALSQRIDAIYLADHNPPFTSATWGYSNSYSTGCGFSQVSVSSQPWDWKEALTRTVQEIYKLARFGITESEFTVAVATTIKECQSEAEMNETTDHGVWMEGMIESKQLGLTMTDMVQDFEIFKALARSFSSADVTKRAAILFEYVCNFGSTTREMSSTVSNVFEGGAGRDLAGDATWLRPENASFSIFISGPESYYQPSTPLVGGCSAGALGALCGAVGLAKHQRLVITEEEVCSVVRQARMHVQRPWEVSVPAHVMSVKAMDRKMDLLRPSFVEMEKESLWASDDLVWGTVDGEPNLKKDTKSEIVLGKLSNGVRVSYRSTVFESHQVSIVIVVKGGRIAEDQYVGSSMVGVDMMTQSGVGDLSSEELFKFCQRYDIHVGASCDNESITFEARTSVSDGGVARALEVIHMMMTACTWDNEAFERSKKSFKINNKMVKKSVESLPVEKLLRAVVSPNERLVSPTDDQLDRLTPEIVRQCVESQLVPEHMEVTIVGDLQGSEEAKLLHSLKKYLGTLEAPEHVAKLHTHLPFASESKRVGVTIKDDERRTMVILAYPIPNRWGCDESNNPALVKGTRKFTGFDITQKKKHPMYYPRVWRVLCDMVNKSLFEEVREKRGLLYSVSFTAQAFNLVDAGIAYMVMNPFHDKVKQTIAEAKKVLEAYLQGGMTQEDLDIAKNPLVASIETSLFTNSYWHDVMSGVNDPASPKTIECTHEIADFYRSIDLDDVKELARRHLQIDKHWMAVGVSGKRPSLPKGLGLTKAK